MANMLDYLDWRGDLSFRQSPFSAVDALILSEFSYLRLQGLVSPKTTEAVSFLELSQSFEELSEEEMKGRMRNEADRLLLEKLGSSKRFGQLLVTAAENRFDEERELQFAAVTVLLGDNAAVAVYRGTDSTLTGWKEDFNLSFLDTIPGQWAAKEYLERIALRFPGELITAGHSKGGNLAVFGAAACDPSVQKRVRAVYNNDGPGFSRAVLGLEGYRNILDRIHTFVPESSVVGMLLEHEEPYTVVRSSKSGIWQHEPYSWQVLGADFIRLTQVSEGSKMLDQTVRDWLFGLTREQREEFVEGMYALVEASDAKRPGDLIKPQNMYAILQKFGKEDGKTRQMLVQVLARLLKSAARNLASAQEQETAEKQQNTGKEQKR